MPVLLAPAAFLALAHLPVADVRSPAEYARGHVPGAANLPLFQDDERAEVGTLYKQQGQAPAMRRGLEVVSPRLPQLVEAAQQLAPDGRVGLHCWRGGLRSGSVAWLLETFGLRVHLLQGGYKAYRQWVLQSLAQPRPLLLLGGATGSGKTEVLHQLAAQGHPTVDLEALARHKGSVFGGLGQPRQPRQEQFENELHQQWAATAGPLWLEDESYAIGRLFLPQPLWQQMANAPLLELQVPLPLRLARLVREYAGYPPAQLAEAIGKLQKRLGPQHAQAAIKALYAADFAQVAEVLLRYYDRAYEYALAQRPRPAIPVPTSTDDPAHNAALLVQAAAQVYRSEAVG
ncbi:MAG: tRNA 2-selenouridine(34) synthase MnmH [Bernardetiaceae bacterium]|jgi:tRNA 2-selenouridine synthase|nr:tRNA 2-selenouridine(34) synthase MnmH [Bernardetiaceae bacterium]